MEGGGGGGGTDGPGPEAHFQSNTKEVIPSSQQELHTRETEVSLPSTHSPSPLPFCLHQLRKYSEGREANVLSPELGTLNIKPKDSQHC